jgi:hypothetical protein
MELTKRYIKGYYQLIDKEYKLIEKADKKKKKESLKDSTLHYYDGLSFSKIY